MALRGGGALLGLARFFVLLFAMRAAETVLGLLPARASSFLDLFVLYAAFGAFKREVVGGAFFGLGVGLFRDLTSLQALGTDAFPCAAVGAFAAWSHRKLVGESTPGLFLILGGAVLVHDLVAFAGLVRWDAGLFLTRVALATLPAALVTALVGTAGREFRRGGRRRRRAENLA